MRNLQNQRQESKSNPPRGGQHTLTLFGIPGERSKPRPGAQGATVRSRYSPQALAAREAADKAATEQMRAFRANLAAKYPASRPAGALPVASPAQVATVASLCLHLKLRRDKYEAIAQVAEREVRPVEDVLNEYLSDLGHHVQQEQLAEVYEDQEPPTGQPLTQAMRLARYASEERERSLYVDDEAAVEITMAVAA